MTLKVKPLKLEVVPLTLGMRAAARELVEVLVTDPL